MGKIHWAKLAWFLRVPQKFSCEHLAIVTLLAKASRKYSCEKLHRAKTMNVLPSKSFPIYGIKGHYIDGLEASLINSIPAVAAMRYV